VSPALAEVVPIEAAHGARDNGGLLRRYRDGRSPEALDTVVRTNQRLLHHILKRFSYADEPYEDLLQVANVGLIKAAQNFDPTRGIQFSTYATALVDGEIRHYLRDSLLLRQPRWLRRLYAQIQEAIITRGHELGRPPTTAEIAKAANITEDGVLEVMALYSRIDLHSWSEPHDGDGVNAELDTSRIHSLHAESFSLPIEDRIALDAALGRLTDFQRRLIELLFYREFTQREVAEALGVTTKKVSRELSKTLMRLKELMGKRVF
jgi:RNA polymerase sigma-B factor